MGTKVFMKAPARTRSASVEGHEYEIPKDGIIELAIAAHQSTLEQHGFVLYEKDPTEGDIDEMSEDQLIVFIEQHGEDADDGSMKKLRKQAKAIIANKG